MGLDSVKLSPFLVKELFATTLIDTGNLERPNIAEQTAKDSILEENRITEKVVENNFNPIKYLGKNAQQIVVAVHNEIHTFLDDDALNLLINILNSCNITLQDVAIINLHNNSEATAQNIDANFTPKKLIFFGTEPHLVGYPIQIPSYKIQRYNNQQFLTAASLKNIANDKAEKKNLWLCLKTMFEI
jgi:hypothetical protein